MLPAHCTTHDPQLETGTPQLVDTAAAEIAAVLPAGSVVARSQGAFLRALDEHPDTGPLRVDAAEHLRAVAWVLASTASWSTLTARPTWPVLMDRAGLARSTVARWLAWLEARGLLGVVESGTTPRFAPMALAAGAANRAALYVLCVPADDLDDPADEPPAGVGERGTQRAEEAAGGAAGPRPVEESETPTPLGLGSRENPYPGARENRLSTQPGPFQTRQGRPERKAGELWGRVAVARSRSERLALVERLQAEAPALRPASTRALASVLRPWLARPELGWTVAQLLYALDHTPDGHPHPHTAPVAIPHRWLARRIAGWLDEAGRPLAAPSIAAAAARVAEQQAAGRARAERAGQRARIETEHALGDQIRQAAGRRYPALVATVLAHQHIRSGLLPVAAAEALVRVAVRNLAGRGVCGGSLTAARICVAVDGLLAHRDRPGT